MDLAFNHDLAYEVAYKKAYMEACLSDEAMKR